ncbi:hypothetical protein MMC25_001707 [Agyrium rufum]|nr:hypothetical protein [Agyrium rufum]
MENDKGSPAVSIRNNGDSIASPAPQNALSQDTAANVALTKNGGKGGDATPSVANGGDSDARESSTLSESDGKSVYRDVTPGILASPNEKRLEADGATEKEALGADLHDEKAQEDGAVITTAHPTSDQVQEQPTYGEKEANEMTEKPILTEGTTPIQEDEIKYPSGPALTLLTVGLCLATFVVALDNTIIATAIPRITTVFNSLDDVGWYGSAYLLTTTSLQPSFGKIYTYFNVKYTYLIALCIFELGSIICAAAVNSVMLIVGRAIAGAGAAALFSGGINIVGYSVPLSKRPIYIALLSSMFGISSVVGPLIGGVLTDRVSWRWCFWINLPVGGCALVAVFFFFKNPDRKNLNLTFKEKLREMDLLGAFFLITSITCLLLALQWGGTTYPWRDSKVWGCILGFGLLISIFIYWQIRSKEKATIPLHIVRKRTVWASLAYGTFLPMALYTHVYFLPFYFQAVKGTTAEGSGIRTIPYLVSNTIASVIAGGTITKIGWFTPFMWVGAAIYTVGCGLIYTLSPASGPGMWIGYQIVAGFGSGISIQIPFISVQVVLEAKDLPTGNALAIFFNTLGGAVSISIAQNIFSNGLVTEIPKYTHGISPATIIGAGATHIREVTPPDQLAGVLQAYSVALDRTYILPIAVAAMAFVVSLFVEMKSVKGKNLLGGAA